MTQLFKLRRKISNQSEIHIVCLQHKGFEKMTLMCFFNVIIFKNLIIMHLKYPCYVVPQDDDS